MESLISSAKAFGDGTHPTTVGVLSALETIDPEIFTPRIACDMGAGSGILSLAIAKRFDCHVVAADLERESIAALKENTVSARLADRIVALQSDGFTHPQIEANGPYDLIVMNILAEPLLALAHDAVAALDEEGVLILSGMLQWQEPQVSAAYTSLGLALSSRITIGDWVTDVFQKPSSM